MRKLVSEVPQFFVNATHYDMGFAEMPASYFLNSLSSISHMDWQFKQTQS